MWEFIPGLAFGVLGLYLLGSDWGDEHIPVWFLPIIKFAVAMCMGVIVYYYATRRFITHRTHELETNEQKARRGDSLCIAIGLITAGAVIASF